MVKENKMQETEIGLIPEDWEVKKLDEIASLKRGKFTPRPRNNPIYYGGNIPFVQTGDVTNSNGKIVDYSQTLNEKGLAVSTLFKKGTILMTIAANIGYTGILQINMACPDSLVSIDGFDCINNNFLNYYLSFSRERLDSLATSGAQKNLNIELLSPFLVPLPPLAEQEAIAAALSDCDAWIDSIEQLLAKKRLIKQGAMQELLMPREDWEVKELGEISEIVMGQSPLSIYYNKNGIGLPLVQGNADIENRKTIVRNYTSQITKRGRVGDIIMSVRAPVGEIALGTFDSCLGRGVCAIRYQNDYLYHYLIYSENLWGQFSTGSTFDSVNSSQVNQFEINIPKSLTEQTRIATILSDMDLEIEALEQKLNKARQIKQGMMQELLTGRVRLV
ncbi:MAG: restriction endonuclease subunit S [Gelidibacter sp.]